MGRPLVINRELEIAKVLAPYRCTVEVDYGDPADLAERLRKLRTARQEYQAMCSRARRAYEESLCMGVGASGHPWCVQSDGIRECTDGW